MATQGNNKDEQADPSSGTCGDGKIAAISTTTAVHHSRERLQARSTS